MTLTLVSPSRLNNPRVLRVRGGHSITPCQTTVLTASIGAINSTSLICILGARLLAREQSDTPQRKMQQHSDYKRRRGEVDRFWIVLQIERYP